MVTQRSLEQAEETDTIRLIRRAQFGRLLRTAMVLGLSIAIHTSSANGQEKPNAAAEELLLLIEMDKKVESEREQLSKLEYITMPRRTSEEVRNKIAEKKSALFDKIFKDFNWDTFRPEFARLYAETFSEQELNELVAFYKSPAGRKLVEKTPEIQSRTVSLLRKRGNPMIAEMRQAAADALQASISEASQPASSSDSPDPKTPLSETPRPQ